MSKEIRFYTFIFLWIIGLIICSVFSWKFDRWLNWKVGYEPKVEQKIVNIEERVLSMEMRLSGMLNSTNK